MAQMYSIVETEGKRSLLRWHQEFIEIYLSRPNNIVIGCLVSTDSETLICTVILYTVIMWEDYQLIQHTGEWRMHGATRRNKEKEHINSRIKQKIIYKQLSAIFSCPQLTSSYLNSSSTTTKSCKQEICF